MAKGALLLAVCAVFLAAALGCFAGRVGISAWPEEFIFLLMEK